MTKPTGKKRSAVVSPATMLSLAAPTTPLAGTRKKFTPNRQTSVTRPFNYVEPTKTELYEMLRQAVENTRLRQGSGAAGLKDKK